MFLLRFFLFSFVRLLRTRHQNGAAVEWRPNRAQPPEENGCSAISNRLRSRGRGSGKPASLLFRPFLAEVPENGWDGGRVRQGRAPSPATEQEENRRRMVVDAWRRRRKKWKRWREGLVSCSSWEEGEKGKGGPALLTSSVHHSLVYFCT